MFPGPSKGVNVQATKCLHGVPWHTTCKHTRTYLARAKPRQLLTVRGPTFVRTSKSRAATEIDKELSLLLSLRF